MDKYINNNGVYESKAAYRLAWEDAYLQDPPVPLNIDIELASLCNLACPYCFWGEQDFNSKMREKAWDGVTNTRFMSEELALRVIDECAAIGVPAIKMNWRGESTLHPQYSEIMLYAKNKINPNTKWTTQSPAFFDILVNTNGNCPAKAIPGLMCATKVMVSLDTLDPELYPKMRVRGDLAKAMQTVVRLAELGHPDLWVRRVITKDNVGEDFTARAKRLFGSQIKVSEHYCFDRNVDEHHQASDAVLERQYCGYPSQRIMVSSNGLCYPCCVDYDETMPVGNVTKDTLLEIWNGDAMRNLRKTLRANHFDAMSKTCQNCTSWMAYKAKEREFVHDKEVQL
jgi:radical SAM protein with 4Fe4S-binding SPASM domain